MVLYLSTLDNSNHDRQEEKRLHVIECSYHHGIYLGPKRIPF